MPSGRKLIAVITTAVVAIAVIAAAVTARATTDPRARRASPAAQTRIGLGPHPDHVVIVVLENHGYGQVIRNPQAPYISSLVDGAANLTQSYAETHPSQ